MTDFFVIRGPRGVKVFMENGKHYGPISGEKKDEIYDAAVEYQTDRSEENRETLLNLLEPRRDVEEIGPLVRKGSRFYFEGRDQLSLPEQLVDTALDWHERGLDLTPLQNFWDLCLLNPNREAVIKFFEYCQDYGIVITDYGYVILYKAVNNRRISNEHPRLATVVGAEYLQLIRDGEDPSEFGLWKKDLEGSHFDYSRTHLDNPLDGKELLGTIEELYNEFVEAGDAIWEPWYSSGKYGNHIKLGEPVTMPREECDPNINAACSKGLHVGSHDYVESFGRDMDTTLAVLVSPADIVALPEYDHSKIRTCRYFPYGVMQRDDYGDWEEIERPYFKEDFAAQDVEHIRELASQVSDSDAEAAGRNIISLYE